MIEIAKDKGAEVRGSVGTAVAALIERRGVCRRPHHLYEIFMSF